MIYNHKQMAIILQKKAGTYERNQRMRKLVREGFSQAEVGRMFEVTRQCVNHIVKGANNVSA